MYLTDTPDELDQGVILSDVYSYALDAEGLGLVVTPTCDFAQEKADFVQVCTLIPAEDFLRDLLKGHRRKAAAFDENDQFLPWSEWNPSKQGEFGATVKNLARQSLPRYHWLPPVPGQALPLVADFQQVTSHLTEEIEAGATFLARLAPSYK